MNPWMVHIAETSFQNPLHGAHVRKEVLTKQPPKTL